MKTRLCVAAAAGGLVLLSACARQESAREIDWAKAALARNPAFEIVATDESAGVFTVRDTRSGVVQVLRLEDLVAAPRTPPAAKPAIAAEATPPPETAVKSPAVPDDDAAVVAAAPEQTTPAGTQAGAPLAQGPGYSITRGESAAPPTIPATLEGPGYTVVRQGPARPAGSSGPEVVAANVERRSDPIICQGNRLMRIDGETIDFSGDAVIAEKGCDLYISNARISAGGVGIIARQARVHIVNSTIGGTRGSYEASEGAEIYVARSTITGVGRRFDSATMNDLGENTYQIQ
jgi:hypothetical protein